MTQPGTYVIPKGLARVYKYRTNAKLFHKLFCKMYSDHFLSSQIQITVSYILWLADLVVVSFLRSNNNYFYK